MSKAVQDENTKLQNISIRLVFLKPKNISLGSNYQTESSKCVLGVRIGANIMILR